MHIVSVKQSGNQRAGKIGNASLHIIQPPELVICTQTFMHYSEHFNKFARQHISVCVKHQLFKIQETRRGQILTLLGIAITGMWMVLYLTWISSLFMS